MTQGNYRRSASIIGVLFIIATVTSLTSAVFLGDTLEGTDYLMDVAKDHNNVFIAVLFESALAISLVGYGVVLMPILRKRYETLAMAYMSILIIEAVLCIIGALSLLLMVSMGRDYAEGTLDNASSMSISALLMAIRDWSLLLGTLLFFGVGSLILNCTLYLTKIVPRWLSVWGIIGCLCILLYGLMGLFGTATTDMMSSSTLLAAPIAVQEMVFASWLIIKGFNSPAVVHQDEVSS